MNVKQTPSDKRVEKAKKNVKDNSLLKVPFDEVSRILSNGKRGKKEELN